MRIMKTVEGKLNRNVNIETSSESIQNDEHSSANPSLSSTQEQQDKEVAVRPITLSRTHGILFNNIPQLQEETSTIRLERIL